VCHAHKDSSAGTKTAPRQNCYESAVPYLVDFQSFAARKTAAAMGAVIPPLVTIEDRSTSFRRQPIGNAWTRERFDGDFYLFDPPQDLPALSLVFVQSRNGNTVARDPASLGGGPVDFHLIYEGLSRVAANAVLAGAATVGKRVFFSVWHPEIVALRREFGLPRHPAQVVVSGRGRLNLEESLLYNVPEVPVYVIAGAEGIRRFERSLAERPWITIVPLVNDDLADALRRLRRDHGLTRVSVVGGRTVATALLDAGLVQDLCLTTSTIDGGAPNTPFYAGSHPPRFELIVRKRGSDPAAAITFDQSTSS
jgi:riboflavin biosynthesis pyrimidine reductase